MMLLSKRGFRWILAGAVVGAGVLVNVGLFGPEQHEEPVAVLDAPGTSAKDSASPAGPRPGEKKDRRASRGRLDLGVNTPVQQPVHHEEGPSLVADEWLEVEDGTPMDAPALRKGASSSEARIAEVKKDRSQSDSGLVPRGIFLRTVPRSTRRDAEPPDDWAGRDAEPPDDWAGRDAEPPDDWTGRDAEPPDDWTGRETSWRRDDERNQGTSIERDGTRGENGGQGTGDVSAPALKAVSVGSPVMMTCANEPWVCNAFSIAFILPNTIPAASNGTEAIQFPIAGGPDIVWIRTESGVIEVATQNLTNADQLAALIDHLVPPR
jgi:hypothetical protein